MFLLLVAALAAVAPAAPSCAPLVGEWRTTQPEMAGGLQLTADGHFRYALSYGAADESAAGTWVAACDHIELTSNPMPTRPAFQLLRDDPAPAGTLSVALAPPGFGWEAPLDVILFFADGTSLPLQAEADGRVVLDGMPYPTAVVPAVPVYGGEPSGAARLDPARGHRLTFRFLPNDLGTPAFMGERLWLEPGGGLLLTRFNTAIHFRKVHR